MCVVKQKSLYGADHSSRGVLTTVVCLSEIEVPRTNVIDLLQLFSHEKKNCNPTLLYNGA